MSLFRTLRHWTVRSQSPALSARMARGFEHTAIEELESRLCLGGLTAPPVGGEPYDGSHVAAEVAWLEPTSNAAVDTGVTPALQRPGSTASTAMTGHDAGTESTGSAATRAGSSGLATPLDTDVFASASGNLGSHAGGSDVVAGPANDDDGSPAIAAGGQVTVLQNTGSGDGPVGGPAESAEQSLASADSLATLNDQTGNGDIPWWLSVEENVVVRYDFRDHDGYENVITDEQQAIAVRALEAWTEATDGKIVFVRDTTADARNVVNLGVGDLAAYGGHSTGEGTLGIGGGQLELEADGSVLVRGAAWLDVAETWDVEIGNGDPEGTYDFFTVLAHETGHVLGYDDSGSGVSQDMMNGVYTVERSVDAVRYAAVNGSFYTSPQSGTLLADDFSMRPIVSPQAQLTSAEVTQMLQRASAATASQDAIIAVVDRGGRVLGVHVEAQVLANIPDRATLIFAIDGAIAKARTAAFFSNGDPNNGTLAPLTSRLVQFISQSTVTQREVQSNPNDGLAAVAAGTPAFVGGVANPALVRNAATLQASTLYGPGTVAPIGLGGHFPPEVPHTPVVDLFAIEHTNRDSLINPGVDGIKGTADDQLLTDRFNTPGLTAQGLFAPESYGFESGEMPFAQGRGIATLPGGFPIFRDTNGDRIGDSLIGGIGVFFPGTTGFADFEQNFVPGAGQTQTERLNAFKVLESEFIAFAAIGGSITAQQGVFEIGGAIVGPIAGIPQVQNVDLPFGRLDLVGIQLPVAGPIAGREGLVRLINMGPQFGFGQGIVSGGQQPLLLDPTNPGLGTVLSRNGQIITEGWLVPPRAGGNLTADDVAQIINTGIQQAQRTRAAVRLPVSSQTRMVFAVSDLDGNILGLFRMPDATVFSIDVAVAKARNAAYYADPAALQEADRVDGIDRGTAFSARTFRFLAEPRYPSGVDGTVPPPFSILNDRGINPTNAENLGDAIPAGQFDPNINPNASVLGYDSFFPQNNFQDPDNPRNQNGIVFFPGSTPLYKNGQLVGGFGVSGDGVDQDDVVTFIGAQGFLPPDAITADNTFFRDVRLPFQKFLRSPTGNVFPFG